MNLVELLRSHARCHPQLIALIDTRHGKVRGVSFLELESRSARLAALLVQAGLQPGDTVLVFQPMSAELYIALAAIFRLGLVAMFLDPAQGQTHIEQCCTLRPPQVLIASTKAHLLRLRSPALRRIPHKIAIGGPVPGAISWWRINRLFPHSTITACAYSAPALLTFTSGSTGQPKATMRTHGFLLAQHRVLEKCLSLAPGQIDLTTMPIFTLANLASGVTSLIPNVDLRAPGTVDPAAIVQHIETQYVSRTAASPALLERLTRYCLQNGITLPGLTKIFTGGAPVFPRLLEQLHAIAPNAEVEAVYGSTEAEPMAKLAYDDLSEFELDAMVKGRGLLAGTPVEAIELKVIPNQWGTPLGPFSETEFSTMMCPPGEAGEIVVSGEHVLPGYLYGQGDRETKFQVGGVIWHRTGDAGYLDTQGRVWLLGRCAACVKDRYGMLYPLAVESAVSHQPNVRRAAVISHQGRRLMIIECYRPMPSTELENLKARLTWAHLDDIQVWRHLPVDKRHNAKIDYPALYKKLR